MLFARVTLLVFLCLFQAYEILLLTMYRKNNVNPRVEIVLLIEYEFIYAKLYLRWDKNTSAKWHMFEVQLMLRLTNARCFKYDNCCFDLLYEVANNVTMLCSEVSSARAQLDLLEQLTSPTPDGIADKLILHTRL